MQQCVTSQNNSVRITLMFQCDNVNVALKPLTVFRFWTVSVRHMKHFSEFLDIL